MTEIWHLPGIMTLHNRIIGGDGGVGPLVADGYATGTTGGAGGETVYVTNASEWNAARTGSTPRIIIVDGSFSIGNYSLVGSNKTITGTPGSVITGNIRIESTNVIVQYLTITSPAGTSDYDGVGIANNASMVWVHHCDFMDCTDGMCDITTGSDNVTVSWCKFYYTTDYDHALVNLIGSNDATTSDAGKLHCTFHHCWWSVNCKDRMVRARYGRVHMYNCYWHSFPPSALIPKVSAYVTAAIESEILVENGYFESGEDPFYYYGGQNGKIKNVGCYIDPAVTGNKTANDAVFTPPYSYTLQTPADAKAAIIAGAGAPV